MKKRLYKAVGSILVVALLLTGCSGRSKSQDENTGEKAIEESSSEASHTSVNYESEILDKLKEDVTEEDSPKEKKKSEYDNVSDGKSANAKSAVVNERPEDISVDFTVSSDGVKISDDPSDFVLVSDVVPEVMLDIRYYSTYNFVGERIDGYEEPVAMLTWEAADALKEVSEDLSEQGYGLKIYDAYRPQTAVDNFVEWSQDMEDNKMKDDFYPELDKSVLFSEGYIASHSGHSRGSTVDLTLYDLSTDKELDMGGTFDYFGMVSHSDYAGITDEQYANRMILKNAMTSHGFKSISTEWWHFTLKNEPYPDIFFTFPVNSSIVND